MSSLKVDDIIRILKDYHQDLTEDYTEFVKMGEFGDGQIAVTNMLSYLLEKLEELQHEREWE